MMKEHEPLLTALQGLCSDWWVASCYGRNPSAVAEAIEQAGGIENMLSEKDLQTAFLQDLFSTAVAPRMAAMVEADFNWLPATPRRHLVCFVRSLNWEQGRLALDRSKPYVVVDTLGLLALWTIKKGKYQPEEHLLGGFAIARYLKHYFGLSWDAAIELGVKYRASVPPRSMMPLDVDTLAEIVDMAREGAFYG